MDEILRKFNGDPHTKGTLVEYLIDFIEQEAIRRIYERKDVTAIADAHELILKAFEQLEVDYGIKVQHKAPTNYAE